nr:MAG TPA: hypothetical protein [Bacteriophage sp.]
MRAGIKKKPASVPCRILHSAPAGSHLLTFSA